jgi:hypothetical protein
MSIGEVFPVLVQQLELERVRDGLGRTHGLASGSKPPTTQAADLLLDVGVAVGVAQDRQVTAHAVDLVGDDVEVLGRVQGHHDAGHRPRRPWPTGLRS